MVIHFLKVPKNFLRIHPKLKRPKYWVYTSSLVPILSRDLKWWVGLLTITDVYTGKCSVYSFNFWVVQNTVTILSLIWYMHIKRDFPLLTLNGLIFFDTFYRHVLGHLHITPTAWCHVLYPLHPLPALMAYVCQPRISTRFFKVSVDFFFFLHFLLLFLPIQKSVC